MASTHPLALVPRRCSAGRAALTTYFAPSPVWTCLVRTTVHYRNPRTGATGSRSVTLSTSSQPRTTRRARRASAGLLCGTTAELKLHTGGGWVDAWVTTALPHHRRYGATQHLLTDRQSSRGPVSIPRPRPAKRDRSGERESSETLTASAGSSRNFQMSASVNPASASASWRGIRIPWSKWRIDRHSRLIQVGDDTRTNRPTKIAHPGSPPRGRRKICMVARHAEAS